MPSPRQAHRQKRSNTASAALLIPILAAIATGMGDVLTAFGGAETMLIGVALCASLAMALPISTPPNALAYATVSFPYFLKAASASSKHSTPHVSLVFPYGQR